jgi:hypothetical protein
MNKKNNNKENKMPFSVQGLLPVSAYDKQALTMVLQNTIALLEKYIEAEYSDHYQDWQQRKQIHDDRVKISGKFFDAFSTSLLTFGVGLKHNPEGILEGLRDEFYRWIDATRINAENCPENLKVVLFEFNEVLKGKDEKILADHGNREREIDPDSSEYDEKFLEVISSAQTHLQNEREKEKSLSSQGWNDFNIESKFNGDAEKGKKTLKQIEDSISLPVYQNFYFFPQKNDEQQQNSNDMDVDNNKVSINSGKNTSNISPNQPKLTSTKNILIISSIVGSAIIFYFFISKLRKVKVKRG